MSEGPAAGATLEITGEKVVIGREEGCDLRLDDPEISRRHVEVTLRGDGRYEVNDLGSRNGTIVDGERISGAVVLRGDEKIEIGDSVIKVEGDHDSGATRMAAPGGETKIAAVSEPMVLTGSEGPGKGTKITAGGDEVVIGRDDACDVVLDDDEVSRRHVSLKGLPGGAAEINDLGSRNGTTVDGKQVTDPMTLSGGETVKIGQSIFTAGAPAGGDPGATRIGGPPPVVAPDRPRPQVPPGGGAPAGPPPPRRSESKSKLPIVAAVIGGVVVIVAILAIAGVFGGGDDSPPTAADIVDQVKPSTVLVLANVNGQRNASGSGWVYDVDKGLIVTNAHVVDDGTSFKIGVGTEQRAANVVGVAPCDDLAVLHLNRTADLETLPLGSQSDLQQGDPIYSLGFPGSASLADNLQVTEGIVSVVKTRLDAAAQIDPNFIVYPNVVQTDSAINPGNSGGPSVDSDGNLVGVNTVQGGNQDQNYAIGVDQVKEVIPQISKGDSLGWAGFAFEPVTNDDGDPVALQITEVLPGTDAANLGLTPGLGVLKVNGQDVTTRQDYCNAVQTVESGETVPVDIYDPSNNQFATIRITFE